MATIRDVAKKAKVSPSTVSRLLNDDETLNVTTDTRTRVFNAVKELDYKKTRNASVQASCTIGILQWVSPIQEIEDNYYLLLRQGIENYCSKNKINVVRAFKTDINYIDALKNVDGIITIGKFTKHEIIEFKELSKNLVVLDMPISNNDITSISLDFESAVNTAMDYLYSLGHRKIGFLGGKEYLSDGTLFEDKRKEFFTKFCKKNNIDFKKYSLENVFSADSGYSMIEDLINCSSIPSAFFCASDPIAIGAIRALEEFGYKIPEEISIIGFNNTNSTLYTRPPLTTMHAPAYEMGKYGGVICHNMIKNTLSTNLKIMLPCQIEIRSSCVKN